MCNPDPSNAMQPQNEDGKISGYQGSFANELGVERQEDVVLYPCRPFRIVGIVLVCSSNAASDHAPE